MFWVPPFVSLTNSHQHVSFNPIAVKLLWYLAPWRCHTCGDRTKLTYTMEQQLPSCILLILLRLKTEGVRNQASDFSAWTKHQLTWKCEASYNSYNIQWSVCLMSFFISNENWENYNTSVALPMSEINVFPNNLMYLRIIIGASA